ncbi:ScyD/ScyE family protein [Georgenia satyanarayanai]|uniref:ScyD/ScyE family protein n=1 Tax=Georgenia satyanarayanai TaxID=860221 RepID=UPI002040E9C5|nr:ScyD/ScyE family protein [Georgenia satyanarayanai]MCM3661667.1 ScyD/ScyE family protein [Georgenia satyanarayanai]
MRKRSTLTAGAGILALAASLLTVPARADDHAPEPEVVTGGLIGPLTVAAGDGGDIYVTQTFANTLSKVDGDGAVTNLHSLAGSPETAELVGVTYSDGATYHIESDFSGEAPTTYIVRTKDSERTVVSDDLWAHEIANNPDRSQRYGVTNARGTCLDQLTAFQETAGFPLVNYHGIVESHGYQLEVHDGTIYVADAAANAVLKVDESTGDISTVDVLPGKTITFTAGLEAAWEEQLGLDIPNCIVGKRFIAESVPTDVQVGWLGGLYVSTLGGGAGEVLPLSSVYWISPDAEHTFEVAGDLHGATGLDVTPDGTVIVAEMFGGRVSAIPHGHNEATTLFEADSPADVAVAGHTVYAVTGAFGEGALVKYGD